LSFNSWRKYTAISPGFELGLSVRKWRAAPAAVRFEVDRERLTAASRLRGALAAPVTSPALEISSHTHGACPGRPESRIYDLVVRVADMRRLEHRAAVAVPVRRGLEREEPGVPARLFGCRAERGGGTPNPYRSRGKILQSKAYPDARTQNEVPAAIAVRGVEVRSCRCSSKVVRRELVDEPRAVGQRASC